MRKYFRYFIPCFCLAWLSLDVCAQMNVFGYVVDEADVPIENVNVSLLKSDGSNVEKIALTDDGGKFVFSNIRDGKYKVIATLIGFNRTEADITLRFSSTDRITLEKLVMTQATTQLDEVTISIEKPLIERKTDRLILNVEGSPISIGNTAIDILSKAPGIVINNVGEQISLNGRDGVLIMIDNRPTYMSRTAVLNMLKSMPSNQIVSIEIMSDPSAKYDAAGTAGIINIKTKKNRSNGFNLDANAGTGYGRTTKYNGGVNIGYRKGDFNFFGNYNYLNNGSLVDISSLRSSYLNDTINVFDQSTHLNNRRTGNSYKLGADYQLNKIHTIGVLMQGYHNKARQNADGVTTRNNPIESEHINLTGDLNEQYTNTFFNVNYSGRLDSSGKSITVDFDYSIFNGNKNEFRDNIYTRNYGESQSTFFVNNRSASKVYIKAIKADYVHPISNTTSIELGGKSSWIETDNNLLLANRIGLSDSWQDDLEATGRYLYKENVNAGYVNVNKSFVKTDIKAGLRVESTNAIRSFSSQENDDTYNYLNFFPSFSLSHKLNRSNQLGLAYSRRIDRPTYGDLNPYLIFIDEYNYARGNPYLMPQYTNSVSLSNTFQNKFTATLNYSETKDPMINLIRLDNDGLRTYAIKENLGMQRNVGLNISGSTSVLKFWKATTNLQVFNAKYNSQRNDDDVDNDMTSLVANLYNVFALKGGYELEASVQYRSAVQYGIYEVESQAVANIVVRKSFFADRFRLELYLDDVFDSKSTIVNTMYNMDFNGKEKYETRIAWLTLRYRINRGERNPNPPRVIGSGSENNRLTK